MGGALLVFAISADSAAAAEVRWVNGGAFGGGPAAPSTSNCVSDAQREEAEAAMAQPAAARHSAQPRAYGTATPYPFVPIAGTEWQDRFVNNFVDLNTGSPGILDWDCTDFTYDGHTGHDIDLRSFGEQDVGVPVFAALDGTVTATHDGEFDRNTSMSGQPANYVILYHGGTHYSWYWHLRKNSVAVSVGQIVRAGTQLGLAASSGNSTGPHLHFESRLNNTWFEPSAGSCRAGGSGWVSQIPVRRDMYLEDIAIHDTNSYPANAWFPYNPYRTGTIVRTGTYQPIGTWFVIHNQPANSTWRLRYLRPNASVFYDSGTQSFGGNPFYRYANWWFYYNLAPDVTGAWSLEISVNGQVLASAPFTILNAGEQPVNRAPSSVPVAFDPPQPDTNSAIFCRLTVPLLIDPDYDLMSFRYQWRTNGVLFRDTTNAAFSDAIPAVPAASATLLSCEVTPFDGKAFGPASTAQTILGPPVQLGLHSVLAGQVALSWPTSGVPYRIESTVDPSLGPWTVVTNNVEEVGSLNVCTTAAGGRALFFRLRWP